MWKIPLFDLNYGQQEQDAVLRVLKSRWLTSGEETIRFEKEFSQYLGKGVHCCAVSNGTAALHLALLAQDIGPGDEVIISGLTFVADLNVVVLTGATPVLADISSDRDWNIDPDDLAKKITRRTKAVIVVHYGGWPCDMDPILDICRDKGIAVIEDAAHAPGSAYRGRKCGTLGDIGCFSFFSNKNLAVGEGGMVSSQNAGTMETIKRLRSHGMTSMTIDRHHGKTISYDVVMPGLNYRIDEIRSAIGRVQLVKLEEANKKRRALIRAYIHGLNGLPRLTIPWEQFPEHVTTSGHIFPILLPENLDRGMFMNVMKTKGIQTSIHYPAMTGFTWYKPVLKQEVPVADRVSGRVVTLPLYPELPLADIDLVCREIRQYLNKN